MSRMISRFDYSDYVPLPWTGLFHQENSTLLLENTLVERREENIITERLLTAPNILSLAQITLQRAVEMETIAYGFKKEAAELQPVCQLSMEDSTLVASLLEGKLSKD